MSTRAAVPQVLLDALAATEFLPDPLPASPMPLFKVWFDAAHAAAKQPNPNSMTLATIADSGGPAARVVLCRGMDIPAAYLVFFTNYRGRKGRNLAANPKAAATFHWDHADEQVRFEGTTIQSPPEESDAYFASRPWESRLSAWASQQSQPLATRQALIDRVGTVIAELNLNPDEIIAKGDAIHIPRPPHWGGFRLIAQTIELWIGGKGRLHDRARWERDIPGTLTPTTDLASLPWRVTRLQP